MSSFLNASLSMKDKLIEYRRYLHQNPEVGMELPNTTKYVMEQLRKLGCDPVEIDNSCISVALGGKQHGKTILLRADMDALPMAEESGLPFASPYPDRAHTCGHDIHTAMMIGAAALLKEREDELEGTVKIMFQPGEEVFGGAIKMIEAGILENPKVDAAIDMHVHPMSTLGHLHYSKGPYTTSADNFTISIKGVSCHGSQPNKGIDPINAAAHVVIALQALIAREVPPEEHVGMSICSFNAGNTFNIVPEEATLQGTLRTYNPSLRDTLLERIPQIAEATAQAFRTTSEFKINMGTPPIVNDDKMVDQMREYLKDFGMEFKTNPSMRLQASDDFGYISSKVPSVMFSIGCKPEGVESNFGHNPKVVYDEDVLPVGAAILSNCAFKWLKENK